MSEVDDTLQSPPAADRSAERVTDLVFDVGLHRGEDTAFYLAMGYRVVAFEADPGHVADCRERFDAELSDGRLTIVEGAIAEAGIESIAFFRNTANSSWGTTDGEWVGRREATAGFERVEVGTVDFPAALKKYGVPQFMKIDIEGADRLCLEALRDCGARPRFVSIESDKLSFNEVKNELELFDELGYKRFAVVQQAGVPGSSIETNDLAGRSLSYRFERDASGAFGGDVGPWLDREAAIKRYRRIFYVYKIFGEGGLLRSFRLGRIIAVRLPRYKGHRIPGWYDTHADFGE
jgi:FkbM family methyltransferase